MSAPSPRPPSPVADRPRRRPVSRACDRCRRRKAKCDFVTALATCTHCRDNQVGCTFDLPLARRGPKSKKRTEAAVSSAAAAQPASAFASPSSSSTASWEPPVPVGIFSINHVLSPPVAMATTPHAPDSPFARWQKLAATVALRNSSIDSVVNRCFGLFFEHLYPLTPLIHEASLRDALAYFLSHAHLSPHVHSHQQEPLWSRDPLQPARTWLDASFCLVTAVCAEAAFMLPKHVFPEGESLAQVFLQASRDCLNHYLEADLETPTANSITIRYFHSNCIHAAGKPKYSWHIFGEATRLAQVMRLHDEASLEGLFPIEAELRRRAFWIVYMGDKSAAILNNRPMTIHKYSFESGITTAYPTGFQGPASLDCTPLLQDGHRSGFIAGFNANLRLWQAASDLLLEIRLFQDQRGAADFALTDEERQRLDSLFVHFITCLDDLPPYLQSHTCAALSSGGEQTTQSNQFVIQCANLQVSFQCLRMVITQKFEEIAYFSPGAEQADLRKTEIVRDMLRIMNEAPFWSLQANGEPYVEKIRLIGASLLAIIHRNQTSPLGARARSDFSVLLDILTRLDSKASDALRSTSFMDL
ncbi:hypothetical protein CDD81_6947 [Ophiocordyceps australis]|uniref:Zn(2)-C6 fungal-type domain-containing protein n=1 Tax=Ophiocordyceps australis TaxID=1399860 RepID=A0A2C5YGQ0_9HYPO|nr:hypothetical protein CDD81_6947 [Ophiocordyceps australis]